MATCVGPSGGRRRRGACQLLRRGGTGDHSPAALSPPHTHAFFFHRYSLGLPVGFSLGASFSSASAPLRLSSLKPAPRSINSASRATSGRLAAPGQPRVGMPAGLGWPCCALALAELAGWAVALAAGHRPRRASWLRHRALAGPTRLRFCDAVHVSSSCRAPVLLWWLLCCSCSSPRFCCLCNCAHVSAMMEMGLMQKVSLYVSTMAHFNIVTSTS